VPRATTSAEPEPLVSEPLVSELLVPELLVPVRVLPAWNWSARASILVGPSSTQPLVSGQEPRAKPMSP
jgi:hypothetical protein